MSVSPQITQIWWLMNTRYPPELLPTKNAAAILDDTVLIEVTTEIAMGETQALRIRLENENMDFSPLMTETIPELGIFAEGSQPLGEELRDLLIDYHKQHSSDLEEASLADGRRIFSIVEQHLVTINDVVDTRPATMGQDHANNGPVHPLEL